MRFKKYRLGPELFRQAADPNFLSQVHVIFGGSGAVGGATALQLVSLFEEVMTASPDTADRAPHIVITARTKQEVRQFTSILFRIQKRDHGKKPTLLSGVGYQTVKGVVVELNTLAIDPQIQEFSGLSISTEEERISAIRQFLAHHGQQLDGPLRRRARRCQR